MVSSFRALCWPLPDFGHHSCARKSPFVFDPSGLAPFGQYTRFREVPELRVENWLE